MLKPLKWASIASLGTFLLGALFYLIMRYVVAEYYIRVGAYMPLFVRVLIGISGFLYHFWWLLMPFVIGAWCILCFIVHAIRSHSSARSATA